MTEHDISHPKGSAMIYENNEKEKEDEEGTKISIFFLETSPHIA